MATNEQVRTNMAAVTAVRALLGITEEEATDIVETVRPHIEQPYRIALKDAYAEIERYKKN